MPGSHAKDSPTRLSVPTVGSGCHRPSICLCGSGDQTAAHVFTDCADTPSQGMRSVGFYTKEEVWRGLSDYKRAPAMTRALVNSGWLPQFRVFKELWQ